MMKWTPVVGVILALLFLRNVMPKVVTWILVLILLVLAIRRWPDIKAMFA